MGMPLNFQKQCIVIIHIFYFHVIVIFLIFSLPKSFIQFFFLILEIVFETSIQRRQGQHMDEMTFITDFFISLYWPILAFYFSKVV